MQGGSGPRPCRRERRAKQPKRSHSSRVLSVAPSSHARPGGSPRAITKRTTPCSRTSATPSAKPSRTSTRNSTRDHVPETVDRLLRGMSDEVADAKVAMRELESASSPATDEGDPAGAERGWPRRGGGERWPPGIGDEETAGGRRAYADEARGTPTGAGAEGGRASPGVSCDSGEGGRGDAGQGQGGPAPSSTPWPPPRVAPEHGVHGCRRRPLLELDRMAEKIGDEDARADAAEAFDDLDLDSVDAFDRTAARAGVGRRCSAGRTQAADGTSSGPPQVNRAGRPAQPPPAKSRRNRSPAHSPARKSTSSRSRADSGRSSARSPSTARNHRLPPRSPRKMARALRARSLSVRRLFSAAALPAATRGNSVRAGSWARSRTTNGARRRRGSICHTIPPRSPGRDRCSATEGGRNVIAPRPRPTARTWTHGSCPPVTATEVFPEIDDVVVHPLKLRASPRRQRPAGPPPGRAETQSGSALARHVGFQ